ncbi:hypothetical protein ATDW_20170 [Asticcacaulis sp. DW145]|uniref:hypothetical protein n=1 Tax=Asticcacaulis sp. DW145 TaxID=3095608 RepID=UPI0030886281|nr:hypothetical protein ATDW_20170 [Asticcacaulis sp. DW145]
MTIASLAFHDDMTTIADLVDMVLIQPSEPKRIDAHRLALAQTLEPLILNRLTLEKGEVMAFRKFIDRHLPVLKDTEDRASVTALYVVAGALARTDPFEFKRFLSRPPSVGQLEGMWRLLGYLVQLYDTSESYRPEIGRQIVNMVFGPIEKAGNANDLRHTTAYVAKQLQMLKWTGPDCQITELALMGVLMASRRSLREFRRHLARA